MKLDFVPGPVFENPVRSLADVNALRIPEMEADVPYVLETLKILRREFEGRVPLIGFGGAPFTLACYMVEGKGSKDFAQIKKMMYAGARGLCGADGKSDRDGPPVPECADKGRRAGDPDFRHLGWIVSPVDYERYILPYTKKLIDGLDRSGIPIISFRQGRRNHARNW